MQPRASNRVAQDFGPSAHAGDAKCPVIHDHPVAGLVLRDPSEAEDAVHDAAVQAWLHWGELHDRDRLDAWFDRILVNVCRARLRRRAIRTIDLDDRPDLPGPDAFAGLDDRDVLHRALATLDADHRIAVVLRYIEDLSPAEIAVRTAIGDQFLAEILATGETLYSPSPNA